MTSTTIPSYYLPDGYQPPDRSIPDVPQREVATTADVQAAAEGVEILDDGNSLEFMGKRFGLAESIGLMPMLKFANAAKSGLTSDDMEGLSAMYLLIRSCLDRSQVQSRNPETGEPLFDESGAPVWAGPSQWDLFEMHAIDTNADGDDLSKVINQAVQVISARPRKRHGDSSASSSPTSGNGKAASSSPGSRPAPPGFEDLTDVSALGR